MIYSYPSDISDLDYLINYLAEENPPQIPIPKDNLEKKEFLRALMNIRMPLGISDEFLLRQNRFLQNEIKEKGIVDVNSLPFKNKDKKIALWQGDITRLNAHAIVNAANNQMIGCFTPNHKCIDNAIHSFAGIQLRLECFEMFKNQKKEPMGQAKITKAYNLPSTYILHTVGPIIRGELTQNDCAILKSSYTSCLNMARKYELKNIAFCCISTGEYGFPNYEAAQIALVAIDEFMQKNKNENKLEKIIINVFKDEDLKIYNELLEKK